VSARVFPGVHAMLSVVTLEPDAVSPVHSHPNKQWGVCLEGEWIRVQDGVEHRVKAGEFWQTPPNVPHGGRALGVRCVVLDIFAPPARGIPPARRARRGNAGPLTTTALSLPDRRAVVRAAARLRSRSRRRGDAVSGEASLRETPCEDAPTAKTN
jgi:mannose-6-phosphate isomerase-like protein (cupin superfamily)